VKKRFVAGQNSLPDQGAFRCFGHEEVHHEGKKNTEGDIPIEVILVSFIFKPGPRVFGGTTKDSVRLCIGQPGT
jgi:hypothetical protein